MSSSEKRRASMGGSPPPNAQKRKKKDSSSAVPVPVPGSFPKATMRTKSNRSEEKIAEKEERNAMVRALKYKEFVQVIRVPFTLDSLQKPLTMEEKDGLECVCDYDLGPDKEAQCLSAKFVDKEGKPILFYFGCRVIKKEGQKKPEEITLEKQYENRTQAYWDNIEEDESVSKIFDGLHPKKCERYLLATQRLARDVTLKNDGTRHQGKTTMTYTEEDAPEIEKEEDAGVVHLVHGWIQQGQKEKGLYISGDISNTSTSIASVGAYLHLTKDIARALAIMFEAAFPELYTKYQEAFDAGVWFQDDPGPFLARAIIYKLQSRLHKDRNDVGPSASFPVGYFEGGNMLFPQLKTKLRYEPGTVCIFYSSILYHKVDQFTPRPQTADQKEEGITPGRVGTVMFFPKDSFDILKGKRKNWGRETNFGKNILE